MSSIHAWLGAAMVAANLLAGLIGAIAWWRVEESRIFWPLLRVAQLLVLVTATLGAITWLRGSSPPDLHLVYGLVPFGVAFVAEQLKVVSAQSVLDQRGLADSAAVGRLPQREQRSIVRAIMRRELGVMTASALVIATLGMRAGGWI